MCRNMCLSVKWLSVSAELPRIDIKTRKETKRMRTQKFPYDNAEIEVVKLSGEDVIATSGDSWENVDQDGIDWA